MYQTLKVWETFRVFFITEGRGMPYFKLFKPTDLRLPILIYGSAVVILAVLWQDVIRVGTPPKSPAKFTTWVWEILLKSLFAWSGFSMERTLFCGL
jgi:hypothetical protein